MAFGLIDTSFIDFAHGLDNAYLRSLTMRSGMAFPEMATRLDAALGDINNFVDARMSLLLAGTTTADVANGMRTGRMVAQRKAEYTIARPQNVGRAAHMLAMDEIDISIGFTEDGLQQISAEDFAMQCDAVAEAFQNAHKADVLYRAFSDAEVPIQTTVGQSTATSPGFAGSGTGTNVFGGNFPDGTAVPGGYSHYYRDTTANFIPLVKAMRNQLRKWKQGPFDIMAPEGLTALLVADTAFVSTGSALIRPAVGTSEALVDSDLYLGVFDLDIRVHRPVIDWTSDHFLLFKTYGPLDPRNALIWKFDPMKGREAYVRSRTMFPLADAVAMQKYGINVNDRTALAAARVAASGAYSAPALSY